MLAASEEDDEEEVRRQYRIIKLVFLFSFYKHSRMVARLSKCEITLCIGNTHLLKLSFCRRGALRMNHVQTPFQANAKVKLIQLFLA